MWHCLYFALPGGMKMDKYLLMTDSSCDLTDQMLEELQVPVIQLKVSLDGGEYVDDNSFDKKDLFAKLRSGVDVKTSAITLPDYCDFFEKYLADGYDIVFSSFSSGLSSTCHTAGLAAEQMREKYPDRKIYVVDSLCASLGHGLLIYLAAQKRREGLTVDQLYEYLLDMRMHICHWFTVDDLFYLKRGGRISAASAVVGSMLGIKPVLHMDNAGKLIPITKARGRKASLAELCNRMKDNAIDPEEQTLFICQGDCIEDAEYLAGLVKQNFGVKKVIIGYVGSVIGSHSGPGTVSLFFVGKER